jgi:PQQ-dependent catabolism-associated CXXCW motif protein
MARRALAGFISLAVALAAMPSAGQDVAEADVIEPADYRMGDYRSPVPPALAGATVVTTAQARRIWERGDTLFIDVLPLAPKPANLPEGTIWRQKKRKDIPGSVWLPNVGYGRLHPAMDRWYRGHLDRLTASDKARPILVYCLMDCWMSWNAAKRALEYGYVNVIWYPDGTDGWAFEGLPVETRAPETFTPP